MPSKHSKKDQAEAVAEDGGGNVGAASAEGDADADFMGAARDGVGDDAVEADEGEQQAERSQRSGKPCGGAVGVSGQAHVVGEGFAAMTMTPGSTERTALRMAGSRVCGSAAVDAVRVMSDQASWASGI